MKEEVIATFALIAHLSSLAWLFCACLAVLLVQPESWQEDPHLGLNSMEAMVAHFKQSVVATAVEQHLVQSVAVVFTLKLVMAIELCFELAKAWLL